MAGARGDERLRERGEWFGGPEHPSRCYLVLMSCSCLDIQRRQKRATRFDMGRSNPSGVQDWFTAEIVFQISQPAADVDYERERRRDGARRGDPEGDRDIRRRRSYHDGERRSQHLEQQQRDTGGDRRRGVREAAGRGDSRGAERRR